MNVFAEIGVWVIGTIVADWVVAGRLAGLAPSVDYHYWPPSKLRVTTLALLSAALAVDTDRESAGNWTVLLVLIAIIVYGAAIMADLQAQRDRNRDKAEAPRYSDKADF